MLPPHLSHWTLTCAWIPLATHAHPGNFLSSSYKGELATCYTYYNLPGGIDIMKLYERLLESLSAGGQNFSNWREEIDEMQVLEF